MLGITGVAFLGLAVYLGFRASQWERLERFIYSATALFAVIGGALVVAAAQATYIALAGNLIGYLVASSGFAPRKREFSSLAKERAWDRYQAIMVKNKWYNFTLGSVLIIYSIWKLIALA